MKRSIVLFSLMLLFCATAIAQSKIDYTGLSAREERTLRRMYKDYKHDNRGYFGTASAGVVLCNFRKGLNCSDILSGVDIINGFSFNPYINLGAGIGGYYQPEYGEKGQKFVMPIYLYLKANLTDTTAVPYLAARVGGAAVFGNDFGQHGCIVEGFMSRGTFFIEPEVGCSYRIKDKKAINLGVSLPLYAGLGVVSGIKLGIGFTW